jgi:hypothetical protein
MGRTQRYSVGHRVEQSRLHQLPVVVSCMKLDFEGRDDVVVMWA